MTGVGFPGTNDNALDSRNVPYGAAIDGYGLRDCDRAKAAGIEHIDLAATGGLGYRTREGLTWRCAAAWICVVTDP